MQRTGIHVEHATLTRSLVLLAAVAIIGCSGNKTGFEYDPNLGGSGGTGGTAGAQPSEMDGSVEPGGGTGGGGAGVGGGLDAGAGTDAGVCEHQGASPLDVELLDVCPDCPGGARCLPNSLVPEDSVDLLASCSDTMKCVPELFIEKNGDFIVPSCRSLNDAEGRCMSVCIPQIAAQADRLPRDTCGEHEVCAPCYDPNDGEPTGACGLSCDPGPTEPPKTFDGCCGGLGSCVDVSLVPEDQRDDLGADSCTGEGQLCAPRDFQAPEGFVPETCRSLSDAEGRCLPACLPAIASQADRLPQSSCAEGHLCAPCFDPLSGDPTGACGLSNDPGPTEDPVVFDEACCGSIGRCLPTDLVPESDRSSLGVDSCSTPDTMLCVPENFVQTGYVAPTCASIGGSEGRCLPACLPSVASQADRLPSEGCDEGHLCAPCYDPFTGEPTGACSVASDPGPQQPPFTFPRCCGDTGVCLDPVLVPEESRGDLGTTGCDAPLLCTPEKMTEDDYVPPTCRSIGNAEGRCLSECLPSIASRASNLERATCDTGELCAPCFDPITGDDTGACRTGDDAPTEPPYLFPKCCGAGEDARGTCVPRNLVPESQRGSLNAQECEGQDVLCAPTEKAMDSSYRFPTCEIPPLLSFLPPDQGACLPSCFSPLSFPQRDCGGGESCVPCDIIIIGSTGACN